MIALPAATQAKLEMLSPAQRDLFYLSGVFAPHAAFEARALLSVWQGQLLSEGQLEDFLPQLAALAPHFLGQQEAGWYHHTSLQTHAYALEMLTRLGEAGEAHQEHLRFYQNRSEAWADPTARVRLGDEVAQYHHAMQWAQLKGYEFLLAFALAGCQALLPYPAYHAQIQAWLDTVLNVATTQGEGWGLAAQFRNLGDVALRLAIFPVARACYYHALARWGESGMAGQAHTFKSLGDLSLAERHYDNAKSFYHKALVLYEVQGFKLGQANTLKQLGWVCAQMKDRQSAQESYQRAAHLYAEMDFSAQQAASLKDLADLQAQAGQWEAAQAGYQSALDLYQRVEFWDDQAQVHLALGHAYRHSQDHSNAQAHYQKALPLYQQGGLREGQAQALRAIGDGHLLQKNFPQAEQAFRQALALYQQMADSANSATLQILLTALALDQGHSAQAIEWVREALTSIESLSDLLAQLELKRHLGRVLTPLGSDLATLYGPDLPDWLRPSPAPSNALAQALTSSAALLAALESDSAALLHQAAQLDPQARADWLTQALALYGDQDPNAQVQLGRALLLRELAGLPGREVSPTLHAAIEAYDRALQGQQEDALAYGRTQNRRVALLRDMAGMRGEDRRALLFLALAGSDDAVEHLRGRADYPQTLFHRANLLRELAGLKGEDRAHWMLQALAVYDDLLTLDSATPLERATTQTNRASLLQEIADLPLEDRPARLQAALLAAIHAWQLSQEGGSDLLAYQRVAERMLTNVRRMVISTYDQATFESWWGQAVNLPQPDWLML